jgi:predicted Zn-ribbon and HTH transcriptional regulator
LDQACYYECSACGYEFLSKQIGAACPRYKGHKLAGRDMKSLADLDE